MLILQAYRHHGGGAIRRSDGKAAKTRALGVLHVCVPVVARSKLLRLGSRVLRHEGSDEH